MTWDTSFTLWVCLVSYLPVSRMALRVLQCRDVGHGHWVLQVETTTVLACGLSTRT